MGKKLAQVLGTKAQKRTLTIGSHLDVARCLGGEWEDDGDGTPRHPPLDGERVGSTVRATTPLRVHGRCAAIFTEKDTKITFRIISYMQQCYMLNSN